MGLYIAAISKIITKNENPDAYEFNVLLDADVDTIYINRDFADHMLEYNSSDNKNNSVDYVITEDSERFSFSAGSYSSYNKFRNIISNALIGVDATVVWDNNNEYRESPAFKLIDFSDCDGCMDSLTCYELSMNLTDNRKKFVDYLNNADNIGHMDIKYYIELYNNFITALTIGANEGILIFS